MHLLKPATVLAVALATFSMAAPVASTVGLAGIQRAAHSIFVPRYDGDTEDEFKKRYNGDTEDEIKKRYEGDTEDEIKRRYDGDTEDEIKKRYDGDTEDEI